MLLPLILVVQIALFPELPPLVVGRFETEKECAIAADELDKSTRVLLVLRCVVDI